MRNTWPHNLQPPSICSVKGAKRAIGSLISSIYLGQTEYVLHQMFLICLCCRGRCWTRRTCSGCQRRRQQPSSSSAISSPRTQVRTLQTASCSVQFVANYHVQKHKQTILKGRWLLASLWVQWKKNSNWFIVFWGCQMNKWPELLAIKFLSVVSFIGYWCFGTHCLGTHPHLRYIEWKGVKIYDFQKYTFSTLFKLYIAGLGVLIPKRYHMFV